jgi:hypothetical protein
MVMKSSVFWDVRPCSLLKVSQSFGGTRHLHLQGQRISQARNQQVASRVIHLPRADIYIGNRRDLSNKLSIPIGLLTEQSEPAGVQDNTSVPITCLAEQSEPIGEKMRVTSMDTEKVC